MKNALAECERCGRSFGTSTAAVGVSLALDMPILCKQCRGGVGR